MKRYLLAIVEVEVQEGPDVPDDVVAAALVRATDVREFYPQRHAGYPDTGFTGQIRTATVLPSGGPDAPDFPTVLLDAIEELIH